MFPSVMVLRKILELIHLGEVKRRIFMHDYPPWKLPHPLKVDGWKITCPFKMGAFSGDMLIFGWIIVQVYSIKNIYIYILDQPQLSWSTLWFQWFWGCNKAPNILGGSMEVVNCHQGDLVCCKKYKYDPKSRWWWTVPRQFANIDR